MKKLRLLLTQNCNRDCPGCCNKNWDLDALPIVDGFGEYDEVLLTGGEPMLKSALILSIIDRIRKEGGAKIYLYTANVSDWQISRAILNRLDGLTLTLHEQEDVVDFAFFNQSLSDEIVRGKSLRLNVFKGIGVSTNIFGWVVKDQIEWVKDCPLPKNEIFMRMG